MGKDKLNTDNININKVTLENALAISSLTQVVSRTSKDIDKLIKHAEKMDSIVVDNSKLEDRVDNLEETVKTDRKAIDLIYTIARYPKVITIILVGSYMFTIDEVRLAIFDAVKPIASLFKVIGG